MKIVHHNRHAVSIVDEIGGTTKLNKDGEVVVKRRPQRTRILVQLLDGKPVVIRGSLMLSGPEIRKLLTGVI